MAAAALLLLHLLCWCACRGGRLVLGEQDGRGGGGAAPAICRRVRNHHRGAGPFGANWQQLPLCCCEAHGNEVCLCPGLVPIRLPPPSPLDTWTGTCSCCTIWSTNPPLTPLCAPCEPYTAPLLKSPTTTSTAKGVLGDGSVSEAYTRSRTFANPPPPHTHTHQPCHCVGYHSLLNLGLKVNMKNAHQQ